MPTRSTVKINNEIIILFFCSRLAWTWILYFPFYWLSEVNAMRRVQTKGHPFFCCWRYPIEWPKTLMASTSTGYSLLEITVPDPFMKMSIGTIVKIKFYCPMKNREEFPFERLWWRRFMQRLQKLYLRIFVTFLHVNVFKILISTFFTSIVLHKSGYNVVLSARNKQQVSGGGSARRATSWRPCFTHT